MRKFIAIMIALLSSVIGTAQHDAGVTDCEKYRSLYYQYLTNGLYEDARNFWVKAFTACKAENQLDIGLLKNGKVIYSKLSDANPENSSLTDTIKWIYEEGRKIQSNDSWNLEYAVLLTKEKDERYSLLDSLYQSVHSLGSKAKSSYFSYYFIHLMKNHYAKANSEKQDSLAQEIGTIYFLLVDYCQEAIRQNSDDEKSQEYYEKSIDLMDRYFIQMNAKNERLEDLLIGQFDLLAPEKEVRKAQVNHRLSLLKTINSLEHEAYKKYAYETLKIEPTADGYLNLARIELKAENYDKAEDLITEAEKLEADLDKNEEHLWFKAQAAYGKRNYEKAFNIVAKIEGELKAKALVMQGDCIAATANDCGESTFQRKANYWLANDYYKKAIQAGANVSSSKYLDYAPSREEIFNEGKTVGESVECKCWNTTTTIR